MYKGYGIERDYSNDRHLQNMKTFNRSEKTIDDLALFSIRKKIEFLEQSFISEIENKKNKIIELKNVKKNKKI